MAKFNIDNRPIRILFEKLYILEDKEFVDRNIQILLNNHISTIFSLRNAVISNVLSDELDTIVVRDLKSYFETKIIENEKTFSIGHLMKILWSAKFTQ